MSTQLHKICDLINNKESLEDEQKFKLASATLVCDVVHNVIDADKKQQQKYCGLFKDRLNLPTEELEKIKDTIRQDRGTVDEKIEYIKTLWATTDMRLWNFLKY